MIPAAQRPVAELLGRLTGAAPIETHISAVFVGRDDAFKLKKAVALPFLDFTKLAARERFCRRELELNRPHAPGIYREVVAVTRATDGTLALGGVGEAVEWVLRMAPVPAGDFLDAVAARGGLDGPLLDAVADAVVALLAAAPVATGVDSAGRMRAVLEGNLEGCLAAGLDAARVAALGAALRARLDARGASLGWPALHAELAAVDAVAAARIHPNDPQRIQRALEVYHTSGRPISEWQRDTRPAHGLSFERWALVPADRATLHARIAARFEAMMRDGFLEEVQVLRARPQLSGSAPALRAVGYRQLWEYLEGAPSTDGLARAVARAVAATRQLAKRQLTWINADPGWKRLDPDDADALAGGLTALQTVGQGFGEGTSGMVNLS